MRTAPTVNDPVPGLEELPGPGSGLSAHPGARAHRRTSSPRAPWWLVAPATVAAVVAVLPIVYLVARTGSLARLVEVVATPATVALTLVDYLTGEKAQEFFAQQTSEYPVVEGVAAPEGLSSLESLEAPAIDLSDLDSIAATQALLAEVGLLTQ